MAVKKFQRDWKNDFDMDDPDFGDLFDDISDELVADCPVARSGIGDGYWVISRYADIHAALQDWETFSSADGIIGANRPSDQPLFKPNESDPPEHTQLRGALSEYFTPRAVAKHEGEIGNIVEQLVDGFVNDGHVEAVSQYAEPFPPIAFCQAIAHMPKEDMRFLQRVFNDAITGPHDNRGANWLKGQDYMADFLRARRSQSRQDDIVDAILNFDFPDGRPYTDSDRAGTLAQIVAAGSTTTGAVISGGLHHLARHPDDCRRLRDNPSLIPRAVEEFLRVFVSAPCDGRRVMKNVDVAGTKMRGPRGDSKGDYVIYNLGGANRDPSVFERPQELIIDRSPNRHLSFAVGIHRCIGLHLARLNIRIAIQTFLSRIPDFSLQPGFEPHFQGGITRSLKTVDLVFGVPGTVE